MRSVSYSSLMACGLCWQRACDEAAALAGSETVLGALDPTLALEAEVFASYVELLGSIYAVLEQRATDTDEHAVTPEAYSSLGKKVDAMEAAGVRNIEAIRGWRTAIGAEGLPTVGSSPKLPPLPSATPDAEQSADQGSSPRWVDAEYDGGPRKQTPRTPGTPPPRRHARSASPRRRRRRCRPC